MANTTLKRSAFVEDILNKTGPRHEPEVEEAQEHGKKGARLAISTPMFDVIFRDGKSRSFGYSFLKEVGFDPGDTLTLKFVTGEKITVEGRGLADYRQLLRLHRADHIQECTESELALELDGISQVERISITEGENQ